MVIDINTLLAAYHFGNEISKSSFGRTLFLRYNDIKSKLSPEAWSLYQEAIKTCSFQHYYSFGLAYKKIEALCSKKEGHYQKRFTELQDCSEVHSLIEEGDQLGRDLENSLLQMFVRLPSKNISGTFNSFDLYRAWMNVFYQLQSTKLTSYLHQHKAKIEYKQGNIQEFLQSKVVNPFSRNNMILIRKLAVNEIDKDIMYSLEFFDGLRNSVLQVIFETHFNRLFLLNKHEIFDYREKERNKIRVFSTKVFGSEAFKYQGIFILLFENNTLQEIGLMKRRVGRNLEMGEKSILTIKGLLYPKNDYNLFVPDLPN
jgi:hypothetical protein